MKRLAWLLAALALLLCCLLAAGLWATRSAAGSAWLLQRLPGLAVDRPQGALLGEFSARRLEFQLATGDRVRIEGLQWSPPQLDLAGRRLALARVSADAVHVQLAPSATPLSAPRELALPMAVDVAELAVQRLDIDGVQLDELRAAFALGPQQHRLQLRSIEGHGLRAQGELSVAAQAPLQTRLALQLEGVAPRAWTAALQATGPLERLTAKGSLQAEAQSLSATATLEPFAAWPLTALELRTEALDLAALDPAWPRTQLSADARLRPEAQRLRWHLALRNALPGRWDQQRLPVQQLRLDLLGHPERLAEWRIETLEALLPGGGRLQGRAEIEADGRWRLDARADGLRPEQLDQRLAAARLAGPIRASGGGDAGLALDVDLNGSLGASAALQLRAQVRHPATAWQIDKIELRAGTAHASLQGEVWPAGQAEETQLHAQLDDADPSLLWKGPWPRMRLSGRLDARLHGLAGQVDARLEHSELAGQALEATLGLQREQVASPWRHEAEIRLGGHHWQSRGAIQARGFDGHVALQSPDLAALAALWPELPAAWRPQGRLSLDTELRLDHETGVWRVQATGQGKGQDLRLGSDWRLNDFSGRWQLPAWASAEPLKLELEAHGLRHARGQLRSAQLQLLGSWAEHQGRLELDGELALPRGTPLPVTARTTLHGGWRGDRWQGRLDTLQVQGGAPGNPPWLAAEQLDLALQPQRIELAPGRATVAGAALGWQAATWQPGRLDLNLTLEPLAVAPLLARWQPDFGWGGDLRVAGHARLHWAEQLDADLLLERQSGDLSVTDDFGPQRLGLSDLRLALNAEDHVWRFAQGLAGSRLGSFVAAQTLHARGAWPDADSRLEGVLQARVENLSAWGAWVPAPWRLGGKLDALAQLGGRMGAPEWRGQAQGQDLALWHPLYGVDLHDGRFALALKGSQARLTEWVAKAGDGEMRAQGEASLGVEPQARLQLDAQRLQILGRADRRLVVSGRAELQLSPNSLQLQGALRADQGLIDVSRADAPSLADDVVVQRGPNVAAASKPASTRKTRVDLSLDFGKDFKVVGRGLKTELRGALKLAQHDGPLNVTGKLQAQGGDYAAYGQKLEIERGDLSFTGPYDNPALDLIATRPNTDTRVGVRVTGTAQSPRVALFSEPELPETDKLSWLLLGRGPDGLGRTDTALLQRAALALLSGEGESVTGRALRGIGLDELSLSQTDDDTRSTIVRLGKQLSRRWYVGYERSLNATTGSWQLIYRIAQRFTLRAQSGDDNALDLIWQWRWD